MSLNLDKMKDVYRDGHTLHTVIVLLVVHRLGRVTSRDILVNSSLPSTSAISKATGKLRKMGLIERSVDKRGGKWELTERGYKKATMLIA